MALRLRGGPGPGEGGEGGKSGTGGGAAEPQFEALDTIAMSGLSDVIYSISQPISLVAGETAAAGGHVRGARRARARF